MKIATKFNSDVIKKFKKHSNKSIDIVMYLGAILFFVIGMIFFFFKEYGTGIKLMVFFVAILAVIPAIKSLINEKAFSYFDNLETERVIEYNFLEEKIDIRIYENEFETREINVKYIEILHVQETSEHVYIYTSNHCVYALIKSDIENIGGLEDIFVKNYLRYKKVK